MRNKLVEVFKDLETNEKHYSSATNGEKFEEKLKAKLTKFGIIAIDNSSKDSSNISKEINELLSEDLSTTKLKWKNLKDQVLKKNSIAITKNPWHSKVDTSLAINNLANHYIYQPYGSQNFPDFIIFSNNSVIPIEIKFSRVDNVKKSENIHSYKPVWNSNLPKDNAIYIYGVAGKGTTFFLGRDVLNMEVRNILLDYFSTLDKKNAILNEKLKGKENSFGFYPYIRKAYEQKARFSTYNGEKGNIDSYFSKSRWERQEKVIEIIKNL